MEPLGLIVLAVLAGSGILALDLQHRASQRRAAARGGVMPTPGPMPPYDLPGPAPLPGPSPTPSPKPSPEPGEVLEEIAADWKEVCWWTMDSPADAYLEFPQAYVTTWPVDWDGEEEIRVWMEPSDLATVEPTAYWSGDELLVQVVVRPKRRGWGTLTATEGTPGKGAVSGETPWRAQCMKIEVV